MYSPSEEDMSHNFVNSRKNHHRRVNKKFKFKRLQSKHKFAVPVATMTSWAESFTGAATWQLNRQLAYWKAKAEALENEIQVIRKHCYERHGDKGESHTHEPHDPGVEEDVGVEEDDSEYEVSEEYMKFLKKNKKYRDYAKRERERLRAKYAEQCKAEETRSEPMAEWKSEKKTLKELYGENEDRIGSLESYVQCKFNKEKDSLQPPYWPVIPFNFNFT